jgi:hypothetical protein
MYIYNLQDFNNISFNGFDLVLPEETIQLINLLSKQVGSPTYIKTPIFQKKLKANDSLINKANSIIKKRKGNKGMEITSDDWESLRTFQVTKIEAKTGINAHIDQVRLMLNKLTDKTFLDIHDQIINIIEILIQDNTVDEEMTKISTTIFELASTNKFYSKIYADLYAELLKKYSFLKPIFDKNYCSYTDVFKNIEYGDPNKDYDRFCEINKVNEKRKSISTFFVNLAINHIITKESIISIMKDLLVNILELILIVDKKNEVDELTENIAILYNKQIFDSNMNDFLIDGNTITSTINKLANSKSKDYKSLSNKAIFKYMDLVDM